MARFSLWRGSRSRAATEPRVQTICPKLLTIWRGAINRCADNLITVRLSRVAEGTGPLKPQHPMVEPRRADVPLSSIPKGANSCDADPLVLPQGCANGSDRKMSGAVDRLRISDCGLRIYYFAFHSFEKVNHRPLRLCVSDQKLSSSFDRGLHPVGLARCHSNRQSEAVNAQRRSPCRRNTSVV